MAFLIYCEHSGFICNMMAFSIRGWHFLFIVRIAFLLLEHGRFICKRMAFLLLRGGSFIYKSMAFSFYNRVTFLLL